MDDSQLENKGAEKTPVRERRHRQLAPKAASNARRAADKGFLEEYQLVIPKSAKEEWNCVYKVIETHKDERFLLTIGVEVDRMFFNSLATRDNAADMTAMNVLAHLLWEKMGETVSTARGTICDPWLMATLSQQHTAYEESYRPTHFNWDYKLKRYVDGLLPPRPKVHEWVKDTDSILCPMFLESKHWVGLVICIKEKSIVVLDPCAEGTQCSISRKYMERVCKMFPNMIHDLSSHASRDPLDRAPYKWYIAKGLAPKIKKK